MNGKYLSQAKLILGIGFILILISPYILTRNFGLLDFSYSGQIGDTIGGITAPIVSLLGSILVFYALKAQIDANAIIQGQIKSQREDDYNKKTLQYFFDQFKMIREDINEFSANEVQSTYSFSGASSTNIISHKGSVAFNYFLGLVKDLRKEQHKTVLEFSPKLAEIKHLLNSIDLLLNQISNSNVSSVDKEYYKTLIAYLFESKLRAPFNNHEKYRARLQKVYGKPDLLIKGIPDEIYNIVDSIKSKI